MKNRSIVLKVGFIAGFLFFAHALIPDSNAWPLLWPGLAGIFLVSFLKKQRSLENYSQAVKSLFKTGLLSAGIFFVFTFLVLLLLNLTGSEKAATYLGAQEPIMINSSVILGLLLASGLGIILSIITGSLFYPFLKK